jgi:MFS family permease
MVTSRVKLIAAIDLTLAASFGLILPILPLFLIYRIPDATIFTIALSYSIFLTAKAFLGWVFALFMSHEKTDTRAKGGLIAGSLFIALTPIAYLNSTAMAHIFLAQILLGLGFGFLKISWMHLTHQTIEELLHETLLHIHGYILTFSLAIAAVLGGFIAYNYGFNILFYTMALIGALATILSIIFTATKEPRKQKTKK